MRILIAIIAGCCLHWASVSTAADFSPYDGSKPIVVLIYSNPWLDVVGSDTPHVAIYENGDVILLKESGKQRSYMLARLEQDALAQVRERLKPILACKDLKSGYSLMDITDAPEAMFYVRDGEHQLTTRVYGMRPPDSQPLTELAKGQKPVVLPHELLALYEWLWNFDPPRSEPWKPWYVEVMFWDYSYASDPSIQWPQDWPAFDSDRAVKRISGPHEVDHSIFLDGSLLPKLREFFATRNDRGAVELDGKKWAVQYRYAFPSEPVWKKAFKADEIKAFSDSTGQ